MTIYWDGILEGWSWAATAVISIGVPLLLCAVTYLIVAATVTFFQRRRKRP